MKQMTIEEFQGALRAQNVPREHYAFKCPMCNTVQSATSLVQAGVGDDFEAVQNYLGFSCVGRWKDGLSPSEAKPGEGCNWTLGGLFKMHQLEVVDEEGKAHPHFAPASPEEAEWLLEFHGVPVLATGSD